MGPPPADLRGLRLDLAFDGTDFLGWQRQPAGRTVQGVVEDALASVLGAPHAVLGAGRTDRGAHAAHLVATTRTRHAMEPATLRRALEARLPEDVGVLAVSEVPPDLHAIRDAAFKWYRYTILVSPCRSPLLRRTTWRLPRAPDREALAAAVAPLVGRHDFAAFANAGSPRPSTVRTIHAARWEVEDDLLHLDVVGDGFLYRMVRTIVGTAVAAAGGPGRLPAAAAAAPATPAPARARAVAEALLAGRDREQAGPAAPAQGLCLRAVGMRGEAPARLLPSALAAGVESEQRRRTGGKP